jgi:hypothetical protein
MASCEVGQNPLFNALNAMKGVKYSIKELREVLEANDLPYRYEVDEEINRIYDRPSESRSLQQITHACEHGKLAEIAARIPINPQDGKPWLRHSTKRFHDCVTAWGTLVEIKNRKDIKGTINKFFNEDRKYNKSKYLMLYTHDDTHLWLDTVIDTDTYVNNDDFDAMSIQCSKGQYKTYTITEHQCSRFIHYKKIRFIDGDKYIEKTPEWFLQNRLESNKGYLRGGWYVFHNRLVE